MLFNSAQFLVFFPLVVTAYFALPHRWRWPLLLAAGYYFYACWRVEFLGLLMFSTAVDYIAGLAMVGPSTSHLRKTILGVSVATNLGLLFFFKYFDFVGSSTQWIASQYNILLQWPELKILLPVGISFYTFQSLSYTIDVYRGVLQPERHLGIFATFVSFFPQLVAGPIERAARMLPQFHTPHSFSVANLESGLWLMLWGFVKKVAIADRLALYVNPVYGNPAAHDGFSLLIASYFFAIQIYCDFSGYTDIARGAARILGFDLMVNFRQPFLSASIREFWQRWHISLSTWFRDYLYIPLGGNRRHHYRNLMVAFLVSGLWHGANWTFVIWGAAHGLYMVVGDLTSTSRQKLVASAGLERWPKLLHVMRVVVTFHLVLVTWVFFRANTLTDALLIFRRIGVFLADCVRTLEVPALPPGWANGRDLIFVTICVGLLALLGSRLRQSQFFAGKLMARSAAAATLFWFIVIYGVFNNQQFIYFQF